MRGFTKKGAKNGFFGVFFLVACMSVSACNPYSIKELRNRNDPFLFSSQKTYQDEFRALMEYCDRCYPSKVVIPTEKHGFLYEDEKRGEITLISRVWGNYHYVLQIEIEENKSGGSDVIVYSAGIWNKEGPFIKLGQCDPTFILE